MQEVPKLLILDRQTLAVVNTAKKVLDTMATSSAGGTVVSVAGKLISGNQDDSLLLLTATVGVVSLVIRTALSYISSITVIGNPIPAELLKTTLNVVSSSETD